MIPVQAAIGGKIIARETIKVLKRTFLTKIHGGGATDRKRKLLEKQKKEKLDRNNLDELKYPKKLLLVFSRFRKKSKWRGGRVVEGARLESVYRGNSIMGSNPILSAINFKSKNGFYSEKSKNRNIF